MNTVTLIPIVSTTINGQASQMVDARLLHTFLDVKRDFSNWIKGRVEEFGFERAVDFVSFDSPNPANQNMRGGDRRSIDYFLTIDMAKELAMVERTAEGVLCGASGVGAPEGESAIGSGTSARSVAAPLIWAGSYRGLVEGGCARAVALKAQKKHAAA